MRAPARASLRPGRPPWVGCVIHGFDFAQAGNYSIYRMWQKKNDRWSRWGAHRVIGVFAAIALVFAFGAAVQVFGDKGQMYPYPVLLLESSQRAIIFYSNQQEILILGTTFNADQAVPVLEFIPFPSEPVVEAVSGDPYAAAGRLITSKQIEYMGMSKGGGLPEEVSMVPPVDVLYSGTVGAHDVTVVKILDAEHFSAWVSEFFKTKGFSYAPDKAVALAKDYLARGIPYFVFDYLSLGPNNTIVEPLAYRFKSDKLYYPLKTSNLVGESGAVNLMLFLPGSLGLLEDRSEWIGIGQAFGAAGEVDVSSSAKMYPQELEQVFPGAAALFGDQPVYGQAIRYAGAYAFKNDLALDVSHIAPFASKNIEYNPDYGSWNFGITSGEYTLVEPYTEDELRDAAAAYKKRDHAWFFDQLLIQQLLEKGLISKSEIY